MIVLFSYALSHCIHFVSSGEGKWPVTEKKSSPIGGAVVFVFLFIHLFEANFPGCVYVCITCFFAKLIVICAEFVNNQSCRWLLKRDRERESKPNGERYIF